MPFGHDCEFQDFDSCVDAIMDEDTDREAAEAICGALKRDTEEKCNKLSDIAQNILENKIKPPL